MKRATRFVASPLEWAMAVGVSLALAGCGSSSPPPPVVESAPATPAAPPKTAAKSTGKGKSMLVEGGEMSPPGSKSRQAQGKTSGGSVITTNRRAAEARRIHNKSLIEGRRLPESSAPRTVNQVIEVSRRIFSPGESCNEA